MSNVFLICFLYDLLHYLFLFTLSIKEKYFKETNIYKIIILRNSFLKYNIFISINKVNTKYICLFFSESFGYYEVTRIPRGATNVHVTDNSRNFLGKFVFISI